MKRNPVFYKDKRGVHAMRQETVDAMIDEMAALGKPRRSRDVSNFAKRESRDDFVTIKNRRHLPRVIEGYFKKATLSRDVFVGQGDEATEIASALRDVGFRSVLTLFPDGAGSVGIRMAELGRYFREASHFKFPKIGQGFTTVASAKERDVNSLVRAMLSLTENGIPSLILTTQAGSHVVVRDAYALKAEQIMGFLKSVMGNSWGKHGVEARTMLQNPLSSIEISELIEDVETQIGMAERYMSSGRLEEAKEWAWRATQTAALARVYMDRGMPEGWQGRYNSKLMYFLHKTSDLRGRLGMGYKNNPTPILYRDNPWLVAGPQVSMYPSREGQDLPAIELPGTAHGAPPALGQAGPSQQHTLSAPGGQSAQVHALPGPSARVKPTNGRKHVSDDERARRARQAGRQRRTSGGKFYDNPGEFYRPNPMAYKLFDTTNGTSQHFKLRDGAEDYVKDKFYQYNRDQLMISRDDLRHALATGNKQDAAHAEQDIEMYKSILNDPSAWHEWMESNSYVIKEQWIDSSKWNQIQWTKSYKTNPQNGFEKVSDVTSKSGRQATFVKYEEDRQVFSVRFVEEKEGKKTGLEVEIAAWPYEARRMWRFVKAKGFTAFLKALKRAGRPIRAKRAYQEGEHRAAPIGAAPTRSAYVPAPEAPYVPSTELDYPGWGSEPEVEPKPYHGWGPAIQRRYPKSGPSDLPAYEPGPLPKTGWGSPPPPPPTQEEEDDAVRSAMHTADQVAHEVGERDFPSAMNNLMRLREIVDRAIGRRYRSAWHAIQTQWQRALRMVEGTWPGKIKEIR